MKAIRHKWNELRDQATLRALKLMPDEALKNSKGMVRARRAFFLAGLVTYCMPMLVAGVCLLLSPLGVMAQQPNGDFFGQNADSFGGMVKAAFVLFVLLLMVYGFYSLGMAFVNYRGNQPIQKDLIAGLGCLGCGAVFAAGWAIRNGTTPAVPTDYDF